MRHTEFQMLLTHIAADYINVPVERSNLVMNTSLQAVADFVLADRAYIFEYNHFERTTTNRYEYCKRGIKPQISNLQKLPYERIPDWTIQHFKGNLLYIQDVAALSEGDLKNILLEQDIKSLIATPMMDQDVCIGFVGFDSVSVKRSYTSEEIDLLNVYAQIVLNLTLRIQREKDFNSIKFQLQQSLEREREVNRMKTQFISMTSHQFRSPLTTIQASAELLNFGLSMQNLPNKEKMEKQLARIVAEVERLTYLMNDIRYMGRAENHRVTFEPVLTDVIKLFHEELEHQHFHPGDVRRPKLSIAGKPKPVLLDQQLFVQMMVNLLSNALKYSPGCAIPEVNLEFTVNHLEIRVTDFGMGIPDKDKPHLFQSFFRGSNVENINGTGLGLAIVKHIVDLHHGHTSIQSKVGEGTTVVVKLCFENPINS